MAHSDVLRRAIEEARQKREQSRALRASLRACDAAGGLPGSGRQAKPASEIVSKLPKHLGWGSSAMTAALRRAEARLAGGDPRGKEGSQADPVKPSAISPDIDLSDKPGRCEIGSPANLTADTLEAAAADSATEIRVFPEVMLAARDEYAPEARAWLLLHQLSRQAGGRGWVRRAEARTHLVSKLGLYGWRRLRQIFQNGEGKFWYWGEGRQRETLFLHSSVRVAMYLGVDRLSVRPVWVPIGQLTGTVEAYNAAVYAAWHSGKGTNNPITRRVIEEETTVPERTQRHYDLVASIERQANYVLACRWSDYREQKESYDRELTAFRFVDVRGRQGPAGAVYVGYRLPNSYEKRHPCQIRSKRRRELNREIDLRYLKGTRGTVERERLFYDDETKASEGGCDAERERYYPAQIRSVDKLAEFWRVYRE